MPQSRAEIQKRYRERKKLLDGEKYLAAERQRQQKYYTPASELTFSERKKRNKNINKRVKKHRKSNKVNVQENVASGSELHESTSGYSSQDSNASLLVVKLPLRRNGPKKRLNNALQAANAKLRRVISENMEVKTKVKSLQRKLQRLSSSKVKQGDLTPRRKTAKFMSSIGIRNEKVKQQLLFGNVIIHQLKTDKGKYARKHGKGVYTSVAGEVIKKYRCIGRVASELKLNRNKLSKVIKNGIDMAKLRRRRTSMKHKESVIQFLEREDNCRIQPGKRDAKKVGDDKIQTRILTDYMANLHQKYQAEQPENKLSLATFCRMRPKNILLTSCLSRNVCLCTKHQNMTLKLQALRKCGLDVPQNPETFITSDNTEIEKLELPETVPYSKWKRVTLENNKKKMKIVNISIDRDQFYEEWLKEVAAFNLHYKTMKTQYFQTRQLKENLPENEIVIHMDFAENYSCKTADEIQSAYWNATQVTLHPMVIYYRGENGKLQHKSYVAVSDVMSHSSSTVLAIIGKMFANIIDLPGCDEVQYVHYWTDSPTSQYRNRYIFNSILNHENLYGCGATWNYYESGHGKNVCDGLGGTVKRLADEALRSGKCTIQDADDFMKWATESSMTAVKFFFVTKEECDLVALNLQSVELLPVKGTMQLHAVRLNTSCQLCTRETSCYCEVCITGNICDTWTIVDQQKLPKEPTKPRQQTTETVECYNTDDFVAAVYEGDWYVGQIVEVDPDDDGYDYKVKFMQKRKALFQWPRNEDIVWRQKVHILCKTSPPIASGKSKRMYRFSETDIAEIEECYSKL